MLINGRKFDIRVFVLVTVTNKVLRGYICEEGYVRTCSKQFSLSKFNNVQVHLTNDAVQKNCSDYSKFEQRNKLPYSAFAEYCSEVDINFQADILPQIETLVE